LRRHVDLPDLGMRVRAANEKGVFHAGDDHVVRIPALAGQEALVFLARNARTNSLNTH